VLKQWWDEVKVPGSDDVCIDRVADKLIALKLEGERSKILKYVSAFSDGETRLTHF
jgi:hypothetical protein